MMCLPGLLEQVSGTTVMLFKVFVSVLSYPGTGQLSQLTWCTSSLILYLYRYMTGGTCLSVWLYPVVICRICNLCDRLHILQIMGNTWNHLGIAVKQSTLASKILSFLSVIEILGNTSLHFLELVCNWTEKCLRAQYLWFVEITKNSKLFLFYHSHGANIIECHELKSKLTFTFTLSLY